MASFLTDESVLTYTAIAGFLVVIIWEMLAPRRAEGPWARWRWGNNVALSVVDLMIGHWLRGAIAVAAAWGAGLGLVGIIPAWDLGWPAAFVCVLLGYEFASYLLHVASHKIPLLWRLHSVHHSDTEVDFSTTYRHHPLDSVLTGLLLLPVIVVLVPPVSAVIAYQLLLLVVVVVSHGNIYVPERVDRVLRPFLVTPDFHRMHHHRERRYTDSNYGALLPWFDYLFGTATRKPFEAQRDMPLGLSYARSRADARLDRLLLMPFRSVARRTVSRSHR